MTYGGFPVKHFPTKPIQWQRVSLHSPVVASMAKRHPGRLRTGCKWTLQLGSSKRYENMGYIPLNLNWWIYHDLSIIMVDFSWFIHNHGGFIMTMVYNDGGFIDLGVSINVGTPIAGWLNKKWNIPNKHGWFRGTPMTSESSILMGDWGGISNYEWEYTFKEKIKLPFGYLT